MFNRMLSFINNHDILSNSQFVFCTNHNTELAILHALDFILKLLDVKIPVTSLYIDIQKHLIHLATRFCLTNYS